MHRGFLFASLVATILGGCSSSEDSSDPSSVGVEVFGTTSTFFAQGEAGDSDAGLLRGPVNVESSCLMVADAVIIWNDSDRAVVAEIVASARQGETSVELVGGGSSLSEDGSDFAPEIVEQSCGEVSAIWYAQEIRLDP